MADAAPSSAARPGPWLVAAGWLVLGGVLALSAIAVEVSLNLFDWRPSWSVVTIVALCAYVGGLLVSLRLHPRTSGPLPVLSAAAVTLVLATGGIARLQAETLYPDSFLGRSMQSPLAYRVSFAVAAALPLLLLVVRRWPLDEGDAWFRRRARRWGPLLGVLAGVLLVAGVTGRRGHDPSGYAEASRVLAGPAPLAGLVDAMFFVMTLGALPPSDLAGRARRSLQGFFDSTQVPAAIKDEVRAACADKLEAAPLGAHQCAHTLLQRRWSDIEKRRQHYERIAFAAFPIAGLALTFAWRARRPRERGLKAGASSGAPAAPPDPPA